MKIKYLIIVSIILAILTMGAISASQDTVSDDNLTGIEPIDENDSLSLSKDNFSVNFTSDVDTLDEDVIEIKSKEVGIYQAYVNNSLVKLGNTPSLELSAEDLNISSSGKYAILVNFISPTLEKITLIDDNLTVDLNDGDEDDIYIELNSFIDIKNPQCILGHVESDSTNLNGSVSVSINEKIYYSKKFAKEIDIHVSDLNIGSFSYGRYFVNITYTSNIGEVFSKAAYVNFTTVPEVRCPDSMSLGENAALYIIGESNISGKVTLYNVDYNHIKGSVFATSEIINGYARIPFNNLTLGLHKFYLEYSFGSYSYEDEDYNFHEFDVKNNNQGFSSTVSSSNLTQGESLSVTLSGNASEDGSCYIDGKPYKTLQFKNALAKEVISDLSVGTHYITVQYDDGNKYFSTTHIIRVKAKTTPPKEDGIKLTLNKVSVKKSAKKLTLTATLKINDKPASGKTITFKFNKKTFTAKTNSKGIAKVTIKKTILKKLKTGKKVLYHAIYGKHIKTVSVKVKK